MFLTKHSLVFYKSSSLTAVGWNFSLGFLRPTRSSSSSQDISPPPVVHSSSNLEFTLTYPSHTPAYLKYRYVTQSSVNMYTTVVPSSLEGRGVAKILANAAFDWAVENKLELYLSCWYLAGYLKRNPRDDVLKLVKSEV